MPFTPPAELFGEQGIIVLIVIAVVLFGSTQIPKLARSLGSAQKEFKKGLDEGANGETGTGTNVAAPATPVTPVTPVAPLSEAPQAAAPAPAPPAADGSAGSTS
jgi:sec-independent protein translocase protein TatA